jgi:hypothetical protein
MKNTERRLESRFLCADMARLAWRAGESAGESEAVLEDISALGVCVQTEGEIPVGAQVTLSSGGGTLDGVVSYCVWRDYGYFVGICLADETHWSSGVFMPDHLTNVRALGSD